VAYQLDLPQSLSTVHNMFHISQLKKCLRVPTDTIDLETLDLQAGLTYEEHPIAILDYDERKVKRSMVKFVKVQWSNHSEDEATWEHEDHLRQDYPDFFSHEGVLKPSPTAPNFLYEVHLSRYHICVHNHHQRETRNVLPLPTTHALYILS
jgi:hypothetical protein